MEKVHLLLTLHGPVWRVRILFGGRVLWRSYRVAEYPTPEAVARRCAAGLAGRGEEQGHGLGHHDAKEEISHRGPLRMHWECWGRLEAIGPTAAQEADK